MAVRNLHSPSGIAVRRSYALDGSCRALLKLIPFSGGFFVLAINHMCINDGSYIWIAMSQTLRYRRE